MKDLKKQVVDAYLEYHDSASKCMRGQVSIHTLEVRHRKFISLLKQLHSQPQFNPEPSAEAKKHKH